MKGFTSVLIVFTGRDRAVSTVCDDRGPLPGQVKATFSTSNIIKTELLLFLLGFTDA